MRSVHNNAGTAGEKVMAVVSFSWWDALMLIGAVLAGVLFLYVVYRMDQSVHPMARQLGSNQTLWESLLIGFVVGIACAGPLVLLSQWVRGRTSGLTVGEWLWIIPIFLYIIAVVGSLLHRDFSDGIHITWFGGWVLLQTIVSLIAVLALFRVNVHWTDRLGCASCFLIGTALLMNLSLHPP